MRVGSILSGVASCLPGGNAWLFRRYRRRRPDAGTASARYCYAVWLRHLVHANKLGLLSGTPRVVAEVGPGNSLGTGLAALISGASRYYAFDVMTYSPNDENLKVFDQLVELFQAREPIPTGGEFSAIKTSLDSYNFPDEILSDRALREALDPARIRLIRNALKNGGQNPGPDSLIAYVVPWLAGENLIEGTVDMVFSMSVFEHIDDLSSAYSACARWLRDGGVMSHEIDFRCHGLDPLWNGHWRYPRWMWKIVRGKRPFLINRQPHSAHLALLETNGFEVVEDLPLYLEPGLKRAALASEFAGMTDLDLKTSNVYLLACKG